METEEVKNTESEEKVGNKITIDDVTKVEIRVGEIMSAEPVEGSEKLLKLKVNFGNEERQILSGIAKFFTSESLLGKKVPFITNLKPREMMGFESNGMIMAAKDSTGRMSLLNVDVEIENGTYIS